VNDKEIACTFRDEAQSGECGLNNSLGCRYSKRDFWFFTLNQIPLAIMALFSLVYMGLLAGSWWALIIYVIVALSFFGLGLETRVLCSHCPYWTNDGKLLNCWAYSNTYKLWRYRPEPMNTLEKAILVSLFTFLSIFPVIMTSYGIWLVTASSSSINLFMLLGVIGITAGTLLAGMQFFYILQSHFCCRCVNFSCPLNRVSAEIIKAFLDRNPVMKEAFEKSGYKLN